MILSRGQIARQRGNVLPVRHRYRRRVDAAGPGVTLKCFDKLTGELLWNRFESQPQVDESGNVWTRRTEVAVENVAGITFSATQLTARTLPAPAAGSSVLYRNWVRKISGSTGEVLAEYDQGVSHVSLPAFGSDGNPGEGINSAGQWTESVASAVRFWVDDTAAGVVADYYVGPLRGQYVDVMVWEAATLGAALPAVDPVSVVSADSPQDVVDKFVEALGSAVESVDVEVVTEAGATLSNSQFRIRVEWADPDYYLGTMQVQRESLPRRILPVTGAVVWDGVVAQAVSFGAAGDYTEDPAYFGDLSYLDSYEWGASAGQWNDDGSVTCVGLAPVQSPVPDVWANHVRMVNFDVTGSTWVKRWEKGLLVEAGNLPSDPEPQLTWQFADWLYSRLVTRGGYSRIFFSALSDPAGPQVFEGFVSAQCADDGSGWAAYESHVQEPIVGMAPGVGGALIGDVFTSDSHSGFVAHVPENALMADYGQQNTQEGFIPRPRKVYENAARYLDGQVGQLNQRPVAGLSTYFRRPIGFDANGIYVAGELYDVTEGKVEPMTVAAQQGTGNVFRIDPVYSENGAGNVVDAYVLRFYHSENFALADCEWRLELAALSDTFVSEWFAFDADLATVNASLKTQFGYGYMGGATDEALVRFQLEDPLGVAEDLDVQPAMLWQTGHLCRVNVPHVMAAFTDTVFPEEWEEASYPLQFRIVLQNVERKAIDEIGVVAWNGVDVAWSRDWSSRRRGVTWGRVHSGRVYVAGPEVPAEIPLPEAE